MVVTDGHASCEQLLHGATALSSLNTVDIDSHGSSAADSHDVVPVSVVHRSRGGQVHLISTVVDKVSHRTIGVHIEHVLPEIAAAPRVALLDHRSSSAEADRSLHLCGHRVISCSEYGCGSSRIETVIDTIEDSFATIEGHIIDTGMETAAGVVQSRGRTS
ncbi:hypothetical protein Rhal01_03260 [Rubritalea halochordaticola]|uniref:Uncharacterized protein n=1 Tax=Rubritalea halochordaticola TaxID=714537 RepID=A0ABP9V6T8_9BACT